MPRQHSSGGRPKLLGIAHGLNHWTALTRFLGDGRICMSNNAAERALRGIAVGRRNWTFAGSDRGGERAAAIHTLIETAKSNGIDPQAWLADVLAQLPDHPARRIDEPLPWNGEALATPWPDPLRGTPPRCSLAHAAHRYWQES